jgi:hypothetical protein
LPEHRVAFGTHAGAEQEHALQQPELHVCVPYVLQLCPASGAHGPSPAQLAPSQVPLALHVWVTVPQLPQAIGFVWSGAQTPSHSPETQV